jgi:acyl-CoA synthetase (AMP-forming)/AMP-acid ligase II
VAFLPTSSGTTGLPKTVVLTQRNLVASLCQMRSVHHLAEDDVVIVVVPMFHIFGFQVTLNLALQVGATAVILPRFEIEAFLQAIETLRSDARRGRAADRARAREQRPGRPFRPLQPAHPHCRGGAAWR